MSLNSDIDILAKVALFEGFAPEQLRLIAFGAERLDCPVGIELFSAGSAAEEGYVVASGAIEMRVGEADNLVGTYASGSLIGEVALITATKRATRAVAATDSTLIKISRSLFRRMLEEYPELAVELHARISISVEQFLDRLSQLQRRLDA